MTFAVREARSSDLDAVLELERAAAEAPHWPREEYERMLADDDDSAMRRVLLVAATGDEEVGGFAVGKVIGRGEDAIGELESVAVAQRFRRSGVGRSLCVGVIAWCSAQGAMVVELEVRRLSEGARALYGQLGFVETGVRTGYYRNPGDDAVLMSRVDRQAN